ncbi:(2Fe-2S)-binding protein [Rhodococcus sp. NPDC059968]|uniref:(2Fe-2S)-binding protein n=1 Tax=Rhodococcus sp. NPDC059968 TaxID=3347017 RepID=UPI0036726FF4
MTTREITVTVNGRDRTATVEARRTLADFLREDLGLTGTHLGCEHGVCGACTVMLDGEAARSCLQLAVQADGHEITTVEGLAKDGVLHPVQQALRDSNAFQCGFCTPGFVMSVCSMIAEGTRPESRAQIRRELSGNTCRCTGYQQIIDGVERALAAGTAAAGATETEH